LNYCRFWIERRPDIEKFRFRKGRELFLIIPRKLSKPACWNFLWCAGKFPKAPRELLDTSQELPKTPGELTKALMNLWVPQLPKHLENFPKTSGTSKTLGELVGK
jgi:hypothetical protein